MLIVEDVITAGTAIRETLPVLKAAADIEIAGMVISVDRMEKGKGEKTAIQEVYEEFGIVTYPIVTVKEIIDTIGNAEQIASDSGEEQGTTAEGQDATFKESFSQFTKEAERFTRDTYDRGRNHVNTHHFYRRADDNGKARRG